MENAQFLVLVHVSHDQQFKAHRNQLFADIYQFLALAIHTDA